MTAQLLAVGREVPRKGLRTYMLVEAALVRRGLRFRSLRFLVRQHFAFLGVDEATFRELGHIVKLCIFDDLICQFPVLRLSCTKQCDKRHCR